MRLKEMISDQRSFDFLINSSCYYQTKDIEKSMGEYGYTDVKTPMYSVITSLEYFTNICFLYFRTGTLSTALTSSTPSTTP